MVQIVWANPKRNQIQCFEGRRLHDRHVFRGFESWTRDDGAGTCCNVRNPCRHSPADRTQQVMVTELLQEPEPVAADDEDDICLLHARVIFETLRIETSERPMSRNRSCAFDGRAMRMERTPLRSHRRQKLESLSRHGPNTHCHVRSNC